MKDREGECGCRENETMDHVLFECSRYERFSRDRNEVLLHERKVDYNV